MRTNQRQVSMMPLPKVQRKIGVKNFIFKFKLFNGPPCMYIVTSMFFMQNLLVLRLKSDKLRFFFFFFVTNAEIVNPQTNKFHNRLLRQMFGERLINRNGEAYWRPRQCSLTSFHYFFSVKENMLCGQTRDNLA